MSQSIGYCAQQPQNSPLISSCFTSGYYAQKQKSQIPVSTQIWL